MTSSQFYFGILFYGNITAYIPLLVERFYNQQQHLLLHQIIDIGLGSIYQHISCSLQSKITSIVSSQIRYASKHKKYNKSLQFIQLRQKLYLLPKRKFIQFLCKLSMLLMGSNLFAKMLMFGFEHYIHKNKVTLHILNSIIHDLCVQFLISPKYVTCTKNNKQTVCFGFCRNYKIPTDIMQLCHYYYFILYFAKNSSEIDEQFGKKYVSKICQFMQKTKIFNNRNVSDLWDKSITNIKNNINSECNIVERIEAFIKPKHHWYSAFGTNIISFGQKKIWKLHISPYLGNILIGIVKFMENTYMKYNKKEDFAFDGFAFMPGSGMVYNGKNGKRVSDNYKKYDWTPNKGYFAMTIILDMTQLKCSLRFLIDGNDIGVMFDQEIDPTLQYKIAVAMHEPQKVEIL